MNIKSIFILITLIALQAKATYYRVSIVKDPNVNPVVKGPVASIDGQEGKSYVMMYEGEVYRGREPPNVIVPVKITGGKAISSGGGVGRGFKLDIRPISAEEAVLAEPQEQHTQRMSGQQIEKSNWKWW
ncbi:hypothetical protein PspLS_00305 [Pyricularia sp. CBS 133598]|nr:hypothetical protein PspLS_00305 [Pyricularia sp. CBS 133598]